MAHKIKQSSKKDGMFVAPKLNLLHILVALAPKDQKTSSRTAQLPETPYAQGGRRKYWSCRKSCRDVQQHWERLQMLPSPLTDDHFYMALLLRSRADPLCFHRMWFYMSDQLFIACFEYPLKRCTHSAVWLWHGWCHVKLLLSRHVLCAPYNQTALTVWRLGWIVAERDRLAQL